ncbi:MAG TPA: hypothetical protein VMB71_10455, partial [Acetobacteraceae bacterium]|nr:hypothetical protein [Acetobacteraceae bacterium]
MNACALPNVDDPTLDPLQVLADLAACAMRMARRAVEQYEALTSQPPPKPETTATTRKQPDPGTLFTRAARIVLDCITKESRLLAGLPLAPARAPRADAPACDPEPVRQALRTVTRNHPHGEKLLRAGLEQLESALAAAPHQLIDIPDLLLRVCAASGIHLDRAQRRKLARDPAFRALAAEIPVPS